MLESKAPRGGAAYLVLAGGLIAGACDIVYACLFWAIKASVSPTRIFQSVAAGLLGAAAFQGGGAIAALGLALHFFIAISMSVAYYILALQWPLLARRRAMCGVAYGAILYVVMNFVVIPLSAAPHATKWSLWVALSILVHMFLIGLPIAWFSGRAAAKTSLMA